MTGQYFAKGHSVSQPDFEAVRWCPKAEKQGHQSAALVLGTHYLDGSGCAIDLAESRKYAERAMAIDEHTAADCHSLPYVIGSRYNHIETEEASIEERSLTFLANEGMCHAK